LEVAQSNLARPACEREGHVKKFVEGGWGTRSYRRFIIAGTLREILGHRGLSTTMRFYLSIVIIACTTCAW
jgi:hypothetical protein